MFRALRSAGRLRSAALMTAAAAPFTMNRPMDEPGFPEPQQAEQSAESEEDAVPAFMVTIDPYFLDQLLHRGRQQRKPVAVGGLDFGPSPVAFASPSQRPPAPPSAASSAAQPASSSSPSQSSATAPTASKTFAPPQRQSAAAVAADSVITSSPASAPTLLVLSTDDIAPPPRSAPHAQPQHPQPQSQQPPEDESSFFAPFWSSVKDTAAAVSHSVASLSSSVSSAILPSSSSSSSASSASSGSSSASSAFELGREEGRLEAYRELDGYVQRTEAEKLAMEEEFRRRDREREEQRLLSLAAPMQQVQTARRETGLRRGRVCEEETRAVLDCYRSSMADVLRCDALVREYAVCADRAKDAAFRGSR